MSAEMRKVLEHLKEWDERYPRGKYGIVEYGTQQKSEEELDAICDEARAALALPEAQPTTLKMQIQELVGLPLDSECPDQIVLDAIRAQRHAIRVYQDAEDFSQPTKKDCKGKCFLAEIPR